MEPNLSFYLSLANSNAEASSEATDFISEHDRDLHVQSCKLGLVSPHMYKVISNATVNENVHQPMKVVCMPRNLKQNPTVFPTFGLQGKKKQTEPGFLTTHPFIHII